MIGLYKKSIQFEPPVFLCYYILHPFYMDGKQLDMQFEALLDSFKSELRTRSAEICDFDKIDTMFYTICEVLCREKKENARIVEVTSRRISTKECNNILSWLQSANIISFCDKKDLYTSHLSGFQIYI